MHSSIHAAGTLANETFSDKTVLTDGGEPDEEQDPSQEQLNDIDLDNSDETHFHLDENVIQAIRESDDKDISVEVSPLSKRGGQSPVDMRSKNRNEVPLHEYNGEAQVYVNWESGIECEPIRFSAPSIYTLDFSDEDEELATFVDNGSSVEIELNEGVGGAGFILGISTSADTIDHVLSIQSESGIIDETWSLVLPRQR